MWFLFALVNPIAAAITNHIDKYLISKYFKNGGTRTLIIFSALTSGLFLPWLYFFEVKAITLPPPNIIGLIISGILFILAIWSYFQALESNSPTIVAGILQTTPVFNYILGFLFLGEILSQTQILGGGILIFGGLFLALDISDKIKIKQKLLFFSCLMVLTFSASDLLFKLYAQDNFWEAQFWMSTGFFFTGIALFIFQKKYRKEFFQTLKENKKKILGLNLLNETLTIIGIFAYNFALLIAPIALVSSVSSFQPIFVFLIGLILTLTFPKIAQEDLNKKTILHQLIGMGIILLGAFIII